MQADRDSIQNDLGRLMTDYDNLQVTNDSISANLNVERDRADSVSYTHLDVYKRQP